MNALSWQRAAGATGLACALLLAAGCEALRPKATAPPALYALDTAPAPPSPAATAGPPASAAALPALIVDTPRAAAGYDSARVVYVREPHRLEYFAHSEWVDTPARMLGPLIVAVVRSGRQLASVSLAPSAATGDLRLDTEIVHLRQEFGDRPSRVRFALRATLVDEASHRVLAVRDFEQTAPAASEDPYGGVVAANRAVQTVLAELAVFCGEGAQAWQRSRAERRP